MSSGCEVATSSCTADVPSPSITVKTQEGDLFQVGLDLISQSKTFSHMYEDLNLAEGDPFQFPVSAITSKVFGKVVEWCQNHIGVPEPEIKEDPVTRERIWFELTDAEKTFFNVPAEEITELLMAANYLDIKSLYLFGCQAMAGLMKVKTPEEVRQMLNLEDDLTEEEKDAIRKENVWCQQ